MASQSLGGEHAHIGDTAVSGVLLLRDLWQLSLFPSTRDARGACANGLKNPHEERGTAIWEVISDTMWKAMAHRKAGEQIAGKDHQSSLGLPPGLPGIRQGYGRLQGGPTPS